MFNFKRRENCFKCYASREESEKGGEGSDEVSNILPKNMNNYINCHVDIIFKTIFSEHLNSCQTCSFQALTLHKNSKFLLICRFIH